MLDKEFWRQVQRRKSHECWLWTGQVGGPKGHPQPCYSRKNLSCKRLVYQDSRGVSLPKRAYVVQTCANPLCLNPQHLSCPRLDSVRHNAKGNLDDNRKRIAALCKLASGQGQEAEDAFNQITAALERLINSLVYSSNVCGMSRDDLRQEALLILRFHVIPVYNPQLGSLESFAKVAIRRRIHTLHAEQQRSRRRTLNSAVSLSVKASLPDDPEAILANVVADARTPRPSERQEASELYEALYRVLSPLEKAVLPLYLQGYSYSEMTDRLREAGYAMRATYAPQRTVDNAIQRIKRKAEKLAPTFFADS